MKSIPVLVLVVVALCLGSCGKGHHDHEHDHASAPLNEEGGNAALEREIDKIHNEAMEKMQDIYNLQESLKKKIADDATLPDEKKKEIEAAIARLDSADQTMMDWMHNFKPFPDSLHGAEKAREYLEIEMEKVKKLRDQMNEAIAHAKEK